MNFAVKNRIPIQAPAALYFLVEMPSVLEKWEAYLYKKKLESVKQEKFVVDKDYLKKQEGYSNFSTRRSFSDIFNKGKNVIRCKT